MNPDFAAVIGASDQERLGLFLQTANRLGTAVQNVEKDFWVCWTLDALFNGFPAVGPRLLFKGGTSLSKAFNLISRFSEDIDVTVFRGDLGHEVEPAALEDLSGKQRRKRLDAIREACQAYVQGPMTEQLKQLATQQIGVNRFSLELDPDDKDRQTLLLWFPAVTARHEYIRSAVKIESGAKSALDPYASTELTPYVAEDVTGLNLRVRGVTAVQPARTFWDKIIILHGLRQWFVKRGEMRGGGDRISRHYFDVHRLMASTHHATWMADKDLAEDCARHARLFFGSPDLGLDSAKAGTFTLAPEKAMRPALERDFEAMLGMVFGAKPEFDEVLATVHALEQALNRKLDP